MGNACYRDNDAEILDEGEKPEKKTINSQSANEIQSSMENYEITEERNHISEGTCEEMNIRNSQDNKKVSMDDFLLLKVLGKGSFGKVMLVQHKITKNIFAMKVLLKKNIKNERQKRHTQTERVILETADNQFLVKLRYAFQSPQKLYLVVDYMPCGELFYHLRRVGKFTEDIARFYAAEILVGIQYMHMNNMIYRDLKPENILLDQDGHVKLTDFGLSKILLEDEDQAFSLCGTPEYLAPEILTTKTGYDKNCDWWSYGALLYEMLVGAPPFYSENKKEMIKRILTQPIPYPNYLSPEAKTLLQKLLVLDPKKRLGSENDGDDLRKEAFFIKTNFDLIIERKINPPYEFDKKELKYFDADLIKQIPKDTPDKGTIQVQFQNFSNFTYVQKLFNIYFHLISQGFQRVIYKDRIILIS